MKSIIPRSKKGISPVIATVIIVAVAIAVAIAVAYWVTGIIPAFTRYEELKISSTYVDSDEVATVVVKNSGSATATIDSVLVNGKLPSLGDGWYATDEMLEPGEESTITITAADYDIGSFLSGVVYDFNVHTAAGGTYPASARAP